MNPFQSAQVSFSETDIKFMARAIEVAKNGEFTTSPNPNVGCVIAKDGQLLAEGWHKKAGTGHAEVNAFAQLSEVELDGATVYVTLEPCSHVGRTPACADLISNSPVAKVVVAMLDPNPLVSGRGINKIKDAGKQVEVGLLEDEAEELNPGFLNRMRVKRPFVQVKLAASLDGKTALGNGESKWITGEQARADVQQYRAKSCAILSSAATLIRDDAQFNVREQQLRFEYPIDETVTEIRQPKRLILDSSDRITGSHLDHLKAFSQMPGGDVVCFKPKSTEVTSAKVQIENLDVDQGFNLENILDWCSENEINNLWVEAGGRLSASFIEQGLFDELIVYIAPKVMGQGAMDLLPVGPFENMAEVVELTLKESILVGEDIRLTYVKKQQE